MCIAKAEGLTVTPLQVGKVLYAPQTWYIYVCAPYLPKKYLKNPRPCFLRRGFGASKSQVIKCLFFQDVP